MKLENTFVNTFEEGKKLLLKKIKDVCSDISQCDNVFANCSVSLVALSDFPMSIVCRASVCKKLDGYEYEDIYNMDISEMRDMDYFITIDIEDKSICSDNDADVLEFYDNNKCSISEYIDEKCMWFTDNKTLFAVALIEYFADDRDIDYGDEFGVFGSWGNALYLVNHNDVANMYLYNSDSSINNNICGYNKYGFDRLQYMITAGGWDSFKTICDIGSLMTNPIAKISGPIVISFIESLG